MKIKVTVFQWREDPPLWGWSGKMVEDPRIYQGHYDYPSSHAALEAAEEFFRSRKNQIVSSEAFEIDI